MHAIDRGIIFPLPVLTSVSVQRRRGFLFGGFMFNQKEYMSNWRKKNRDTIRVNGLAFMHKYRFSGNRDKALLRDGYRCVNCGMTDTEHRLKWGCSITVDHIDGNGRFSINKNHSLSNLQTLCLVCHGKKDRPPKKFCIRGHEYTSDNTYYHSSSKTRECRMCWKVRYNLRTVYNRVKDGGK